MMTMPLSKHDREALNAKLKTHGYWIDSRNGTLHKVQKFLTITDRMAGAVEDDDMVKYTTKEDCPCRLYGIVYITTYEQFLEFIVTAKMGGDLSEYRVASEV